MVLRRMTGRMKDGRKDPASTPERAPSERTVGHRRPERAPSGRTVGHRRPGRAPSGRTVTHGRVASARGCVGSGRCTVTLVP